MAENEFETENENVPEHVRDAQPLRPTQLARKYERTYTSWRLRKSRNKAHWSPAFAEFRDFLIHMGPAPEDHTLDRIDPRNPNYGPGLCRWAPSVVQANNRTTTEYVEVDGEHVPLTPLARQRGLSPQTLRRELDRATNFGRDPRKYRPWPEEFAAEWERIFNQDGGAARRSRYQYLIGKLQNSARELSDWLYDHQDDVDSSNPALREAYLERVTRHQRVTTGLAKARAEFPEWRKAVARFEAAEAERRMLHGYTPSRDWDDDN